MLSRILPLHIPQMWNTISIINQHSPSACICTLSSFKKLNYLRRSPWAFVRLPSQTHRLAYIASMILRICLRSVVLISLLEEASLASASDARPVVCLLRSDRDISPASPLCGRGKTFVVGLIGDRVRRLRCSSASSCVAAATSTHGSSSSSISGEVWTSSFPSSMD